MIEVTPVSPADARRFLTEIREQVERRHDYPFAFGRTHIVLDGLLRWHELAEERRLHMQTVELAEMFTDSENREASMRAAMLLRDSLQRLCARIMLAPLNAPLAVGEGNNPAGIVRPVIEEQG